MTWNIDLEIFKITIPSDNINWKDLTLTIKENIKYLPIYFHRYTPLLTIKPIFPVLNKLNYTHDDIIKHWQNNIPTEFTKLQYNKDYYIAPIIVIEKTIILGIFIYGLLPEFIYKSNNKILSDKTEIFSSLSYISNHNNITITNSNSNTNSKKIKKCKVDNVKVDNVELKSDFTFNIIAGIIKYIKSDNILKNTGKYIIINNRNINWLWILCNIVNNLPIFKINIITISSKNKFISNNKTNNKSISILKNML